MTKRVEELMDDTFYMLNELLSCSSPTGNSYDEEKDFFNSIERVKAELWSDES